MATNFLKVRNGLSLTAQTAPSSPSNGDIYYDSTSSTFVFYDNGNWISLASRYDVASINNMTSSQLNAGVTQNSLVRITGGTATNIHGLAAMTGGKQIILYNATTTTVILKYQSATEPTAANRLTTSSQGDVVLTSGQTATLIYDDNGLAWVVASSSATGGSGTGDDLDALTYKASFSDPFKDPPSSSISSVDATSGKTNASYSGGTQAFTMSYDAAKTLTQNTSTTMHLSAAPSFTVAIGDIVRYATQAMRITALGSINSDGGVATPFTIEAAFSVAPSGAACCVSQAVYTKDINNFAADGDAISSIFTDSISDVLVSYNDTSTGAVYNNTDPALIYFSASADGTNYTLNQSREANLSSTQNITSLPTSGTNLYLRFFSGASSGSGTVNLVGYKVFLHRSTAVESGGIQNQAYCFTDGSGTPLNCTGAQVVNAKSQVALNWSYPVNVNSGTTNGALIVMLNGQKVPRYVAGLTNNTYYTEVNANTIALDKDYSTQTESIEIYQHQSVVDSSTQNTTDIATLKSQLGSAGGTKNYLSSYVPSTNSGTANSGNGNFEQGTTAGWSLAHSALTGVTPTSTATATLAFSSTSGGTAANANLNLVTISGGLSGSYSASFYSLAASTAGDMLITNAFHIDTEDQARMMQVKFFYQVHSGAANVNFSGTSSNTLAVWVYDVTNGAWIQPAGVYNLVQNSGTGVCTATFQTTSNSTQYQLALVNINASTGAWTLYIDDFSVGPQVAPTGPAMSDWQSFTLVVKGTTTDPTKGTINFDNAYWRRSGDSMEIQWSYSQSTGGTAGSGGYSFNLPSGYSVDTTKIKTNGDGVTAVVGSGVYYNGSTVYDGYVAVETATALSMVVGSGTTAPTTVASTFANLANANITYTLSAKVPIAGWSSNTVMSSDTDTRLVYARAAGTHNAATSGAIIITSGSTSYVDTHAAYSTSTGRYTVPVSGYYRVTFWINDTANLTYGVYKNGSVFENGQYLGDSQGSGVLNGSLILPCVAGDILDVRSSGTINAGNNSWISFERLSGPAVVAATESVNASYTNSVGTACVANTITVINFDTKEFDSHSAVTTGSAWKFIAPTSGKYRVSYQFAFPTTATGSTYWGFIYKNGSAVTATIKTNDTSNPEFLSASRTLSLNAGDFVDIRGQTNLAGGATTVNTSGESWVSVERVGN